MKFRSGFTLIELLIVVAIIAILAAIAVPNFLEAQVRAKVSRARNDMRVLATGIESYTVDFNLAWGATDYAKFYFGAGYTDDQFAIGRWCAFSKLITQSRTSAAFPRIRLL